MTSPKKARTHRWSVLAQIVGLSIAATATALGHGVYPRGNAFPLQLYSLQPDADVPGVAANGWNIGHRYGWAQVSNPVAGESSLNALMQTFAQSDMQGLPHLPDYRNKDRKGAVYYTEWARADMANWIQAIAPNRNIAYWDLPEEQRYWKPSELQIVKDYSAWTRANDPLQRPNYMYIPWNYTAAQVSHYVPYLDIVPASAYAEEARQPHAWVRWRMEETIRGIQQAGATIGRDYLHGQKTPVGIIELDRSKWGTAPTPAETNHDFWQLIASGAKGIFVFSYFHRNDDKGALIPNWNLLQQDAAEVAGSELGHVILKGTPVTGVTTSVLSGPSQTVSFTPPGYTTSFQFPSIHLMVQQWHRSTYIIAVNSTDQPVTARLSNLPTSSGSAKVMFESRIVPFSGGNFADTFPAWGVHIYKLRFHAAHQAPRTHRRH